jgi:putative oxidoreductase
LLALMFLMAGLSKVSGYTVMVGYMAVMGIPGALLLLGILTEVGGPLAIILGWKTRITAFLPAGFSRLAAALFHNNFSDLVQMILFMKNMSRSPQHSSP